MRVDDLVLLVEQAAKALREMGEFGKAERMLRRVDAVKAQVARPALLAYRLKLAVVIARRDISDEPLDMVPDVVAAVHCESDRSVDSFARAYCARTEIARIVGTLSPTGTSH